MKNADKETAKDEGEGATDRAMHSLMTDSMELYKQYADNPSFRLWLVDTIFNGTLPRVKLIRQMRQCHHDGFI